DARLSGRTDAAALAEQLLSISGGGSSSIARKHKFAIELKLAVRFMIVGNELPIIGDSSGAMSGRFIVLETTESHYGKEDIGLSDRLMPELPGILNWAIQGWERLQNQGKFTVPEQSRELVKTM